MNISEYFEGVEGIGVLATADGRGQVDAAIYAKPHVIDYETIAFIMPDRLTHHNLAQNGQAAYLFKENGPGYKGLRLFLTKIREEQDSELLFSIRRKKDAGGLGDEAAARYLVFFRVDKALPLVGTGEPV